MWSSIICSRFLLFEMRMIVYFLFVVRIVVLVRMLFVFLFGIISIGICRVWSIWCT